MVAAAIRTIFAQLDAAHVQRQLKEVASTLKRQFRTVAEQTPDASDDVTAFKAFLISHWTKLWSTNLLERMNAEIKRRTRVIGIFPNDASALRLITAVCVEIHDEWLVAERRYVSEDTMSLLKELPRDDAPVALAG
jgi:putative transposase